MWPKPTFNPMMHNSPVSTLSRALACVGLPLTFASLACSVTVNGNDETGDGGGACSGLVAGDLVITELMPNPSGTDSGREWFEIYNASSQTISLQGVDLVSAREDGTDEDRHTMGAIEIAAGEYLVVGGVLDAVKPDYVDYGYGDELGDMRNTAGSLALTCGDTQIDRIIYQDPSEGASRIFDGAMTPDSAGNDDLTRWCDSTNLHDGMEAGSPGVVNEPCGGGGGEGMCMDAEGLRQVVAPAAGELIFTELMANPSAVDDAAGEWLELRAMADFDLNGVQLGVAVDDLRQAFVDPMCLAVSAGEYVLVAREQDAALNGGLPEGSFGLEFALTNGGGTLVAVAPGGGLVDEISYASVADGASTSLDPDFFDAGLNDDENVWCASQTVYGAGDMGTPAADNEQCMIPPPEGMCVDGGRLRAVNYANAGDLIITEVMANPDATTDADGEWFELYVGADVDLNEVQIGKVLGEPDLTIDDEACVAVSAGSYLVFARDADGAINGMLPSVDYLFGFGLTNSNSALVIERGGSLLDQVTWTSVPTGASRSLSGDQLDAGANDDDANWCGGVGAYGAGDLGSPGAANPLCGGDGDGDGDGDTTGDGDGDTCLDGGVPRDKVTPVDGDLIINEVMANPMVVGDPDGEWFELYVNNDVDLNDLELGQTFPTVVTTVSSADCIAVTAGSYVLLAENGTAATNGNLPVPTYDYASLGLVNTNGSLFIGHGGVELDSTSWTSAPDGASLGLDPADMASGSFCPATSTYGDGDLGTPAAANDACN